jgi:hypothetical protein
MKRTVSKWILVALSVLALSFLGAARAEACPGCDKGKAGAECPHKGKCPHAAGTCDCAKKKGGKCDCAKKEGKCDCAKREGGKCNCAKKGGDCPHAGKDCPHAKKATKK